MIYSVKTLLSTLTNIFERKGHITHANYAIRMFGSEKISDIS